MKMKAKYVYDSIVLRGPTEEEMIEAFRRVQVLEEDIDSDEVDLSQDIEKYVTKD